MRTPYWGRPLVGFGPFWGPSLGLHRPPLGGVPPLVGPREPPWAPPYRTPFGGVPLPMGHMGVKFPMVFTRTPFLYLFSAKWNPKVAVLGPFLGSRFPMVFTRTPFLYLFSAKWNPKVAVLGPFLVLSAPFGGPPPILGTGTNYIYEERCSEIGEVSPWKPW